MSTKIRHIVPPLFRWFADNARDLPWRRTRGPYAIWVSEIMLQQTQVKTVIPYWERWMRALPTIADLAAARPETIHKLWEGLGYYTRVRNMQRAAVQIMQLHNGVFPRDFESILALPGIGRYTAGAISSIAFNEPQPILDGNVMRVLTRVFGIAKNPKDKAVNESLWDLAEKLVRESVSYSRVSNARGTRGKRAPFAACSQLNQSLMELGALVCTPKNPTCPVCPVQKHCVAFKTGRVHDIPNLQPRVAATSRRFVAFVIEHRGKFLVRQRPAGQVNAHLWEFPNVEVASDDFDTAQLAREHFGLRVEEWANVCQVRHSITRYRITLQAFRGELACSAVLAAKGDFKWFTAIELDALAFTSAHRKVLGRISKTG